MRTFRVCAVEFANGPLGILTRRVGDIGNALRAACAVVRERKLRHRPDPIEEILYPN
jgi:hypothetical protein